ncbi:hypothetical protein 8G_00053 [Ralstonia phage Hyacinthe]|uniref:Uncharacterized protein n=3 Tax=Rahariannevirus raharianne TaxID=2846050 RepID=A0A7G5BBG8_9CAUD|nr:hypothetical protein KMC43_gp72 [Ralstonia phage Raharianne]QMV32447.1 hypothetical protein U2_00072 [Ralstonia phage Albius]QMV33485.1 hypothetical protein 8G_00053 [Ralstonia phage Hyacinthe]QMV33641.1 hypothetical protein Y2_00072 [Ralstonia phage Raharianne]
MNTREAKWVQGAVVLHIDPDTPVNAKQLVRDTDYVLLDMMGKIKHRAAQPILPPVPTNLPKTIWPNWPYKPN